MCYHGGVYDGWATNCAVQVQPGEGENIDNISMTSTVGAKNNLRTPVQVLKQTSIVKVDVLRGVDVVDHQGLVQRRLENYKSLHFMALQFRDLFQTIITPIFWQIEEGINCGSGEHQYHTDS